MIFNSWIQSWISYISKIITFQLLSSKSASFFIIHQPGTTKYTLACNTWWWTWERVGCISSCILHHAKGSSSVPVHFSLRYVPMDADACWESCSFSSSLLEDRIAFMASVIVVLLLVEGFEALCGCGCLALSVSDLLFFSLSLHIVRQWWL